MAILDLFKRKKEQERFLKKQEAKKREIAVKQEFFNSEKKKEDKKEENNKKEKESAGDAYRVLSGPHFTEKSVALGERGIYVFRVKPGANKIMIKDAVSKLYGVDILKVNISKSPSKRKFIRGKRGVKSGYKKAIVYLKKGERIEI